MSFRLSKNSLARLDGVNPALVAVVKRAIEITEVDFAVVQGRRTKDEQCKLYGQGRTAAQCKAAGVPVHYAKPTMPKVTWTMSSRHLTGEAVDLAAYVEGAINWNNLGLYQQIAVAMKRAAMELCTPIEWGGDWSGTKDYPHFQLARS